MGIFANVVGSPTKNKPIAPLPPAFEPFAFATGDDGAAEITLYGDIVKRRPVDWWTGEQIEGSFIILSEFLAELKKIETAPKIRIRIHSVGGHAFDAITIHNRLKELSGKGTDIEVIVDGVAMSGGSIIMCAGNTVKVFPGSLVMIHCCWAFIFGGYNAKELRKEAESNEAADRAQAAIYHAKTGLSQEELLTLMEQETYMTGEEAIDKGFADELVEGATLEIAASADRKTLYVGGAPVWISDRGRGIPSHINIPVFPAAAPLPALVARKINAQPAPAGGNEGGTQMPSTLEELRKENPELANALMDEARAAVSAEIEGKVAAAVLGERGRIKGIDEVSALFNDEIVLEAKYGEKPCTAQELTFQAAQKAVNEGSNFMNFLKADNQASGAQGVGAAPGDDGNAGDAPEDVEAAGKAAARRYIETMGGKKSE